MQGAGATVRVEDEVPRIVASPDRELAEQAGHVCIDDATDPDRRLDRRQSERLGDLLVDRALRSLPVEPHPAAEEAVRIELAEHEVRIGDGHAVAPPPVADGAGMGACALRPTLIRPSSVVTMEPPAGADRTDLDHRSTRCGTRRPRSYAEGAGGLPGSDRRRSSCRPCRS